MPFSNNYLKYSIIPSIFSWAPQFDGDNFNTALVSWLNKKGFLTQTSQ
jgi:hypothetical protein